MGSGCWGSRVLGFQGLALRFVGLGGLEPFSVASCAKQRLSAMAASSFCSSVTTTSWPVSAGGNLEGGSWQGEIDFVSQASVRSTRCDLRADGDNECSGSRAHPDVFGVCTVQEPGVPVLQEPQLCFHGDEEILRPHFSFSEIAQRAFAQSVGQTIARSKSGSTVTS